MKQFVDQSASRELPILKRIGGCRNHCDGLLKVGGIEKSRAEHHLYQWFVWRESSLWLCKGNNTLLTNGAWQVRVW